MARKTKAIEFYDGICDGTHWMVQKEKYEGEKKYWFGYYDRDEYASESWTYGCPFKYRVYIADVHEDIDQYDFIKEKIERIVLEYLKIEREKAARYLEYIKRKIT